MPEFTNPYTAGDPVGKTEFFVGREDVLREVLRTLHHPTQNAITLYGQRRIGKTSILQYLEGHLSETGFYQPVYFDLMHKAGLPLAEILYDLARSIAIKLSLPGSSLENITEKTFREVYLPEVLRTLPERVSLVLLLDEFDVLADPQAEQQSKRQFFSYLRDLRLLDPKRLQFVFVLGRNIDDLDVVAQGLFKDLPSQRVSLLGQKDVELLVRLSERQGGMAWTPKAISIVWKLTSGHPYLTQAICSQIWEDAHDETDQPGPVQVSDVENAIAGSLERSQNMFSWLWDGLGSAEKVVAAALAGVGRTIVDEERLGDILAESGVRILIGELQDAPKILEKWDILVPVNGGYRFRVELLRRWIAENKPLSRTQDELDRINPVANSLFEAALGLYRTNNLDQSEARLREALVINPNHLRANELLAEILLSQNSLDEAQHLLDVLEEIAPGKARRLMKRVYLKRAEFSGNDSEKLNYYKEILTFFPNDQYVLEARKQIYLAAGEQAMHAKDFQLAMESFKQAGDTKRYQDADAQRIQHKVATEIDEITRLEEAKSYQDAYQRVYDLSRLFPDVRNWQPDLDRLQIKTLLDGKYKQALGALQQQDRAQAKKLLAEVIALDPDYEQVSRYFYLAVNGDDPLAQAVERTKAPSKIETHQPRPSDLLETNPETKVTDPTPSPRRLSPWNPLDYLRLLGWVLAKPKSLQIYRDTYDTKLSLVGNRLAYILVFGPLLMTLLGPAIGLVTFSEVTLIPMQVYRACIWGITGIWFFSIIFNMKSSYALISFMLGVIAVGITTDLVEILVLVTVATLALGVTTGVAEFIEKDFEWDDKVRITFGTGVMLAGIIMSFIPITNTLIGSYATSLAGKFTGVMATVVSIGIILGAGLSAIFVTLIIGFATLGIMVVAENLMVRFVVNSVKSGNADGKLAVGALLFLTLVWVTLIFVSLGGISWVRSGTWPTPSWPF